MFFICLFIGKECKAIQLKDSSNALFLRASFKSFDGIFVENTSDSISMGGSIYQKNPRGLVLGLRYSSTFKKIKNNRLSYWTVFDFHYDRFEELFFFDTFPFSDSFVQIKNGAKDWGHSSEDVIIKQASLSLQFGLKYNFNGIRPAIGYYLGYNIYSRTEGAGSIARRFDILKNNNRLINAIHHGIKVDLYIPIAKKFGFVGGLAGTFYRNVPNSTHKFNNIGAYFHAGIDYKISK